MVSPPVLETAMQTERGSEKGEKHPAAWIESTAKIIGFVAALIAALALLLTNLDQLRTALCKTLGVGCATTNAGPDGRGRAVELPRRFVHATGSFERNGDVWTEYPRHQFGYYSYVTSGVADGYVFLFDASRLDNNDPNRPFMIRVPLNGGMAQWSFPNPFIWRDLYVVRPEN